MADFWLVLFLFIPNKYVGEVWRPEEVVLAHRFSQKFDLSARAATTAYRG